MSQTRLPLFIHSVLSLLAADCCQPSPSYSFYYVSEPKSWEDARSYCREQYSDLAMPENMEEMSRLDQAVKSWYHGEVWIGLKGGAHEQWFWSGNATLQYTHWLRGEPSVDGRCGGTRSILGWYDYPCAAQKWFLCYGEKSSPKYVMVKLGKTWIEAQSYCREFYTDLASIESQEDEELIWDMDEGDSIWIGLFKDSWEWADQGRSSFRYWGSETEMAGGSEDCAAVRTAEGGRWYKLKCSGAYPFVCEEHKCTIEGTRCKEQGGEDEERSR
ncbi:macrophage mannose receptor 1-like isoform X2 [Sardina pilchardus]|uniref:macrophage mannose receptor 1-like isoform X2 n=1 Tax=Sardina pilchardus TaxID=27697 RepID=UPI002E133CAA